MSRTFMYFATFPEPTILDDGTWAFHCHVLTHAEGPEGMFGMVTALTVEAQQ